MEADSEEEEEEEEQRPCAPHIGSTWGHPCAAYAARDAPSSGSVQPRITTQPAADRWVRTLAAGAPDGEGDCGGMRRDPIGLYCPYP
jgi:hypothetical protein